MSGDGGEDDRGFLPKNKKKKFSFDLTTLLAHIYKVIFVKKKRKKN